MLTLYKAPRRDRSSSSSDDSDSSRIIPAGKTYITKVNGKLVMARAKVAKKADVAFDLMGEAFGPKTRIIPRRTRSVEPAKGPLLINGVTYVPQLPAPVTYTSPIAQEGFAPMTPMPPYIPPQYAAQYPYPYYPGLLPAAPSQPQPHSKLKPTPQELDQLQHMDQHFHKVSEKALNSLDRKGKAKENDNVVETKTTITIIKHVCAGCGRLRSRKYHHEHPIKEGETLAPDYCRKCQKDASSTSESSDTEREEHSKAKKNRKKKKKVLSKKKSKKVVESSSDTETPVPKVTRQEVKSKPAPARKMEGISFDPREDYIVVEEEISEDESRTRGRTREKVVVEEYEGPSRPAASHDSRNFPRRAHSAAERQDRYQNEPKYVRRQKDQRTENRRHRSPSVDYITVEVPSKGSSVGQGEVKYPKKVPIHFVEEVRYDKPVQVSRSYSRARKEGSVSSEISDIVVETVYERPKSKGPQNAWMNNQLSRRPREYTIEEVESVGRDPPRHEATFQDMSSCSSSRSSEARQRRRRERAEPKMAPWEAPHVIDPQTDADVVVVTERFEYRRPQHDEANRRRQEQVDKTTLEARSHSKGFSAEDASKYFEDDWAGVESVPQTTAQRPRRSYRRDRSPASTLSDAESYDYTISRVGNELPHVPDPPSPFESQHWTSHPPYVTDDDPQSLRGDNKQEDRRGEQQSSQHGDVRERDRSSYGQSEHAPGAWEGRSGSVRMPSPARSRERIVELREDEMSMSSKAERERMAELGARHVTFRSTPSVKSASPWPSGDEESPTRKQSGNSSGWDSGGAGGDW